MNNKCAFCNHIMSDMVCNNHNVKPVFCPNDIVIYHIYPYQLIVSSSYIAIYNFNVFQIILKIDRSIPVTPDSANSILNKYLNLITFL